MDKLKQITLQFLELVDCEYVFTLQPVSPRKNPEKPITIALSFAINQAPHLIGLQYLKDLSQLRHASSKTIIKKILADQLTYSQLQESNYFPQIKARLDNLGTLKKLLESDDKLFFDFDAKNSRFYTLIKASKQVKLLEKSQAYYLFLDTDDGSLYFPVSFFPATSGYIYEQGQRRYHLIKTVIRQRSTGKTKIFEPNPPSRIPPKNTNSLVTQN